MLGYTKTSVVESGWTYILILALFVTAQVLFRVYDQPLPARQAILQQWISRCEGHPVIAAFNYQIDVGKHGFHFLEPCAVVAEKVGSGE